MRLPLLEQDGVPEKREPLLSIVIPVYQEGEGINSLLDHLLRLEAAYPVEIIIVDGNGDSTLQRIHPRFHPAVRTTVAPTGRARQMNVGAEMGLAPNLLFLHADARLPSNALGCISSTLERKGVVAGAFTLEIDSSNPILHLIARAANWRSNRTRIPYGDQAIFISRRAFRDVGGFRDFPLMEDVDLMRRIRARGWPILLLPEKVKVSPRRWEKEGIVHCTLRNWILLLLFHLRIPPRIFAFLYPPPSLRHG